MDPNKDSGAKQAQQSASSGSPVRRQRTAAATDGAARMPLPPDLVRIVFSHLYSDLRDTGGAVVGPCDAARDIAAAALACRGFAAGARAAFADLTAVLEATAAANTSSGADRLEAWLPTTTERQRALLSLANGALSWAEWEALLAAPASLKLPQLKKAAKALRIKATGTKAELAAGIFSALGLPGPTRLPVRLWRACALDHCVRVGDVRNVRVDMERLPPALLQLAFGAMELAPLAEAGVEHPSYRAPAGAPPLPESATLAQARAGLLARGVRTLDDLDLLEVRLMTPELDQYSDDGCAEY